MGSSVNYLLYLSLRLTWTFLLIPLWLLVHVHTQNVIMPNSKHKQWITLYQLPSLKDSAALSLGDGLVLPQHIFPSIKRCCPIGGVQKEPFPHPQPMKYYTLNAITALLRFDASPNVIFLISVHVHIIDNMTQQNWASSSFFKIKVLV